MIYVKTDVAKEEDVKHLMNETVTRFGKIDILVANAGIDQISPAHETSLAHGASGGSGLCMSFPRER